MKSIILASLYGIINGVVIDPATPDPDGYATVTFSADPRGLNVIDTDNTYKLYQRWNNPLNEFGLILSLDADEYGFKEDEVSKVTIEVDGFCSSSEISSNECDAYFVFSFGDQEYFSFVTDFDNYFAISSNSGGAARENTFIYPECGGSVISGDPSTLLSSADPLSNPILRNALAGGDRDNWEILSEQPNGDDAFPITFELENDPGSNTLTFTITAPGYPSGLTCQYEAVSTCEDIKMYFTPDGGNEIIQVSTIEVTEENAGCACEPGYTYVGRADTVNDARQLCENIGSTLATINSDAEVDLYRDALDAQGVPRVRETGNPWNDDGQTAIGLNDRAEEGKFTWDDGSACKLASPGCIDYWGDGEPNDYGDAEDCASFAFRDVSDASYANDINCDHSYSNDLYVFCNNNCFTCDEYIYVSTPMSFEDAQAYCESQYGTSLAGVNKDDIPQANCAITQPGEPTWVGLYSETDPAFFEFVSGEECDIPFSGACVDFWGTFDKGIRAPQCLQKGGNPCGYYRESSELVYNNLDCETEAPFLCEANPVSAAHVGLFNEIQEYVSSGGGATDKNVYFVILTSIAGLVLVVVLIVEFIYCLCKKKRDNKVIYDKLGSEHESEEAGVVKQDI